LNGDWKVYQAGDKDEKKVDVSVPSIFQGNGELVFEKKFNLTNGQFRNYSLRLNFLGLNYAADISVNGVIIYRHSGGQFPFAVDLPKDVLHTEKPNRLSVKLYYKLDSENTIPVKQRFLFPQSFGGIIRDVYIHLIPNIAVSGMRVSCDYFPGSNKAKISIQSIINNNQFPASNDSSAGSGALNLKLKLISPAGKTEAASPSYNFELQRNKEKNIIQNIEISSPDLWSPSNPRSYKVVEELWSGNRLLDKTERPLAVYSLNTGKDSLSLNGHPFMLKGVTYVPSFDKYGELANYDRMEKDIRMIKYMGFNSVRFAKEVPHPYYLTLCEKYGLLAFIEIPVNDIPVSLAQNLNFITRSKNYLINFLKAYSHYSAVAAIGVGSSYLADSPAHIELIKALVNVVKKESHKLTYASFAGLNEKPIDNLDLYGIEFLNTNASSERMKIKKLQETLGNGKVFISGATYTVNAGNSNGYVNKHSFEAQAKYFENLIDYTDKNPIAGFFINSMFDYRGDFVSLTCGYNANNLYRIGLSGEDRGTNRLAYKVVYSKMHNTEKVTIPIGNRKDDSPMVFILFGLLLALVMGVLVNSGRKFREDTSRALLRPYNFYADVRDQRMMSGYHSTILALITAANASLLLSNLLFYFKENIVFEKVLLAFGSRSLIKEAGYLAWHPVSSLLYLTLIFAAVLILFTVIVKAASFFVKTKVFFSSAYYTIIWSFLPLVLLIPVGIILYRILNADIANVYIYAGLAIFTVWIFYRLMKGIYVIFDVNPSSVYFYSILIVLVIIGGFVLYYQVHSSFIDYLQLTFKQYKILG
jgi:beta-galactosidase